VSEATRQPAPASTDVGRPAAPPASSHDDRQTHPLAQLHQAIGNRGVLGRLARPGIQPKLEVGTPDDEHEREADAVAAAVMGNPAGSDRQLSPSGDAIRRAPAPEDEKKPPPAAPSASAQAEKAPVAPPKAAPAPAAIPAAGARAPAPPAGATPSGPAPAPARAAAPGAARAAPAPARTGTPSKKTPPAAAPKGSKPAARPAPKPAVKTEAAGTPADSAAKRAAEATQKGDAKHPTVEPKPKPGSKAAQPSSGPKTGATAKDHPPDQAAPSPHRSGGPPDRTPWPPPAAGRKPDEPVVAAKPATPGAVPQVTPSAARTIQAAPGGGQPLTPADRSFYESRLSRDLAGVRIHDDAAAHHAARDVQARAFAYGQDIFFAAGRRQPGTNDGRELLAHELAHTIQQRPGAKLDRKVQRQTDPPPAAGGAGAAGAAGVTRDPASWTITFPELEVPNFRKTGDAAAKYAGPLTRPKGYSRSQAASTPQREVWINDTKGAVRQQVPGMLSSLHASRHGGQYFIHQAGRGMPERDYIGLEDQLAEDLTTPEWDRVGAGHGFRGFQVDHVLELQLGGTNTPDNLELLDKSVNASSGNFIMESVDKAMTDYLAAIPAGERDDPALKLRDWRPNWSVTFQQTVPPRRRAPREPGPNDRWTPAEVKGGEHFRVPGVLSEANPDALGSASEVKVFPSESGGIVSTLRPADGPGRVEFFKPFRATSATYYVEDTSGPDLASFTFSLEGDRALTSPPPAPVTVKRLEGARFVGTVDRGAARSLLRGVGAARFSPINIDVAEVGPHGIYAEGQIIANLPIIRDTPIDLVLDGPVLTVSHTFDTGDFKLPAPLKVTQSTLRVSASTNGDLRAAGRVDAEIDKLGRGYLAAEAGTQGGLSLSGGFDFTSEIFQQAHVSFAYRDGHYSGEGTLTIASGKVAGLRSGTLHAAYAEDHFDATGHAVFDIPGIDSADIHLSYDATTGLTITAAPTLKAMPGIRSGSISLTVRQPPGGGELKLSGHGTAEPDIPGINAQLTVDYDDGAFLAKVNVPFQMGMINGQIEAGATNQPVGDDGRPAPAGAHGDVRIFGAGSATMQMTPWLSGTAAIRLLANGEVEVHGDLTVPGVALYHGQEILDQEIIPRIAADVPIFPPLELHLAAGLRFKVGYGDGILGGSIGITYNPSHPDDTVIHGALHLHASAYASLLLETEVGLALGVPGASISANVVLGGELRIDANLDDDVQINWTPAQGVVIDNTLRASLEPALLVHLSVNIVGTLGPFSHEFWRTNLADWRWGSGLHMALTWPIHYEDGRPFQPSVDDIHIEKPNMRPDLVGKQILQEAADAS
jgi:hypothetical protein